MRIQAVIVASLCAAACNSGSSGRAGDPDADRDTFAASIDCNDSDSGTWRTISAFSDADRDGVGAGQAVSICAGQSIPPGFSQTSSDCAAADPTVHTSMPYAARDEDGDAVSIVSAGSICGNGTALPTGYLVDAGAAPGDCDDHKASSWQLTSAYEDFDRDGVGHGPLLSVCAGNGTPPGFAASDIDCDDLDGTKWRMVATYSDVDGDGVGSGPMQSSCAGSGPPPSGWSFLGFDPLDTLADPDSELVSDFDLDIQLLIVDSDGDDDDIP